MRARLGQAAGREAGPGRLAGTGAGRLGHPGGGARAAVPVPGRVWAALSACRQETGLVPFLLGHLDGEPTRPSDTEEFSQPAAPSELDQMAAAVVAERWDVEMPSWGSARAGRPLGNLAGCLDRSSSAGCHAQIYSTGVRSLSKMPSRTLTMSIVAGATAIAVAGCSARTVSATSSSSPAAARSGFPGGHGSGARSGPAAGGAAGTVGSMSASGFTISTSAGQKVTVKEASSTAYRKGTSPALASAITTGEPVLVLGTTSATSITATQVIIQSTASGSAASPAAKVIPFQRGAPATSRQVGQIPANYRQGSGRITSGTAANKATEAALAAYPGGIVDRVVKLSNAEYEVHNIGVNWPHHIFVNHDFKVIGAD